MKKTFAISLLIVVLFTLVACGSKTAQDTVSKELGLSVSGGKEISNISTYSGSEGHSCIAISFEDETVLEEIKGNSKWKEFPLDETMQALVYGLEDETGKIGHFERWTGKSLSTRNSERLLYLN